MVSYDSCPPAMTLHKDVQHFRSNCVVHTHTMASYSIQAVDSSSFLSDDAPGFDQNKHKSH